MRVPKPLKRGPARYAVMVVGLGAAGVAIGWMKVDRETAQLSLSR